MFFFDNKVTLSPLVKRKLNDRRKENFWGGAELARGWPGANDAFEGGRGYRKS